MSTRATITLASAGLAILLGLWGFGLAFPPEPGQSIWLLWLDHSYRTVQLLLMEGDPGDSPMPLWQLTLARMAGAIAFFGAVLWVGYRFLRDSLRRVWAGSFYRRHVVVCGLGDRGQALACDLLDRGERVVVVDADPQPLHLEAVLIRGAAFVHGDATERRTLERAGVSRAAHLVTLAKDDSVNIEILSTCLGLKQDPPLHCHLHLGRRESRSLFEEGAPFDVKELRRRRVMVSVFNLYELAAVCLFEQHPLGANADTVSEGAQPISVLIAGFGRVGQAVLLEAMAQGHFCNHVPIRLVVVAEEAGRLQRHFYARHREVTKHANGKGLNLWSLQFLDELPADLPVRSFHHVVSAQDDPGDALASALELLERYRTEGDTPPDSVAPAFAYHAADGHSFVHPCLAGFGDTSELCKADMIIDGRWEQACRLSHCDYARGKLGTPEALDADGPALEWLLREHDYMEEDSNRWLLWENLPLYKRRSNLAEKRHITNKLQTFGLGRDDLKGPADGAPLASRLPCIEELPEVRASAGRLAWAAQGRGLALEEIVHRCEGLARAEHNRWNAFHVLDNWRYGVRKSELLRTHDCLLDWASLAQHKPDIVKYDYKNVYQIPKVLDLVEGTRG